MTALRRAALLLLVLLASPAWAAPEDEDVAAPLTLRQVFGGGSFTRPIPSWSWRPGHAELVRVDERRAPPEGQRPVLVAMDAASGAVRDLLDLGELETLVEGEGTAVEGIGRASAPPFLWRADGQALCAVVRGDLVWVDLEHGTRRRLTRTPGPMADLNLSPDGAHVSFSRAHELWVVSTQGGEPRALTSGGSENLLNATLDWLYPEELDFRTAAWWSPSATRLAYLQMDQSGVPRYRVPGLLPLRSEGRPMAYPKAGDPNPRVRVGVVGVAGGPTRWLDLGDPAPEYVVRVAWKPGARVEDERVLVVTLDRAQRHLRCHVLDPVSGACEGLAFEERDAAWIDVPPAPRFLPGEPARFLWRRQDGSTRWYVGTLGATPGSGASFEALSPEGVDAGDLLHVDGTTRRTWVEGVAHGAAARGIFECSPGCEGVRRPAWADVKDRTLDAQVDGSGAYALLTRSSATVAPRVDLVRTQDGALVRAIGDAHAPQLDERGLAVPEYGSLPVEGQSGAVRWRLWKPPALDEAGSYGLIVHVYGGPGSRMVEDAWGRGPFFPTLLCQRGFLVLQVDGRGSGGQGRDWMKCVQGRLGILELEDQVAAVRKVLERPYVDGARVGVWGWSYGGTMACNALTMRSDVFRAGVAIAPVTDWRLYDTIYTERYMGLPAENESGYSETASVTHAARMKGHLLLMHGLGDDNVHAQNTMRLVEAFLTAGNRNFEMMIYPRRGHGIGGATLDVFTRLLDHFERRLPR